MTPAENIREQILSALQRKDANAALAAEYARLCRDLNRRLEQIEEVLDRGDEIQALQMAEIQPSVMEEADTLSFFKSREWQRLCEWGQVSVAPEIRIHGITRLNSLYGKGITSTHPIYRELREAILARDEERALQIARTIESLAPDDQGAKAERERLERKVFAKLVTKLGKALSANDIDLSIRLLDDIERIPLAGETDIPAEILSARKLREERDALAAKAEVKALFPALEELTGRGDWKGVAELVARIRDLSNRHFLALDAVRQSALENASAYAEARRAQAMKEAEYRETLRAFLICLDDATSRTQASGTLTIEEAGDLLTRLNKAWQMVEVFGMPVDPGRVEETSRMVEKLRNELERLQRNRILSIAALAAVVVLLLTASGLYITVRYRAGELTRELASCREARSVASVRKLLDQGDGMRFASLFPRLTTEMESCRTWVKGEEKSVEAVTQSLADLLKRSADFSKEEPLKLEADYQRLTARVKELPEEQRKILQADLGKLEKVYSDHLAALAAKDDKRVEGLLSEYDKLAEALAAEGMPLAEIRKNLEAQRKLETALEPFVHSPIKDLPLSAALKAKTEAAEEKTKALAASLDAAEAALAAINAATKADAFREALMNLRGVNLPSCNLIASARIAWNTECTAEALLSELLFPGDPATFIALKKGDADDNEARRLYPKTILPNEVAPFAAILNDEITPDVRVCKLEGGDPSRVIYAKTAIKPAVDDGDLTVFTAETYDPASGKDSSTTPAFSKKTYRAIGKGWERAKSFSGGITPAPASRMYRDLGLKEFVSDSLEVRMPALQLLDRVTQVSPKDTIYQAYVIQQLLEMTSKRPRAWGLQYAPGAATLMKEVDQVIKANGGSLQPGSWMTPSCQKLTPQLKFYLEKQRHFTQEAQLNKWLSEYALAGDEFLYAGYVQEDGTPHLAPGIKQPPPELYGIAGNSESRKAALVYALKKDSNPSAYDAAATPVPLTPLYYLKRGREGLITQGIRQLRLEQIRDDLKLPPLFATPEPVPSAPSKP